MKVKIADIHTGERMRALNPDVINELKKSISAIGLKIPVSVRQRPGGWQLVSGLHRLEACRALGHEEIEAREEYGSEIDARLWEISENLHRAELSTLERSEHIAEWIKLTEERVRQPAQIAPAVLSDGRAAGHQHQQRGINAAARELGIERTEAQRAVRRVKKIAPEVAKEIRTMPAIADSGVELDALAQAEPAQQAKAVQAVKSGSAKTVREALATNRPTADEAAASDKRVNKVLEAIEALSETERAVLWKVATEWWGAEIRSALR